MGKHDLVLKPGTKPFHITEEDAAHIRAKSSFFKEKAEKINELIQESYARIENDFSEHGGNKYRFLFSIPFVATTYHDEDDKRGHKNKTFVNFPIKEINRIDVAYVEGKSGDAKSVFTKLVVYFFWKNLNGGQHPQESHDSPYGSSFNDEKYVFGEYYYFETPEKYFEFKEVWNKISELATSLGVYL